MAATTTITTSFIVFSAMVVALAPVKSLDTPSAEDCTSSLSKLSSCLNFVQKGSTVTEPDKSCCSGLKDLMDSKPLCLCQLTGNKSSTSAPNIDTERARKLPKACSVLISSNITSCLGMTRPSEGPGANGPSINNGIKEAISNTMSSQLAFFIGFLLTFF